MSVCFGIIKIFLYVENSYIITRLAQMIPKQNTY